MGYTPRPIVPPIPTRLEVERAAYVRGYIDVSEFERRVSRLLRAGTADEVAPLAPPPKPERTP